MKNSSAFSLIELSIVLIIISLITYAIIGGNSLVRSAKIRAFQNEMHDYKMQFFAFKVINDRYPGDWDNVGFVGKCWGAGCPGATNGNYMQEKADHDFGGEYAGMNFKFNAQPWVELYLSKIGKFKPKKDTTTHSYWNSGDIFFPKIKSIGGLNLSEIETIKDSNNWIRKDFSNNMSFKMAGKQDNMLDPRILKEIDLKFDDGKAYTGKIRTECYLYDYPYEYDDTISLNAKCGYLFYYVDIQL